MHMVINLNPSKKKPEELKPKGIEKILVKTQGGTVFTLTDIKSSTTVYNLKEKVEAQDEKFSATGIKLIFKGKPLTDDNATVESLSLTDGCSLFLVKTLDQKKVDKSSKAMPGVKVSNEPSEFVRFRVPANGPGNVVMVNAPSGDSFRVRVPRTNKVGDVMQVRIPEHIRDRARAPSSVPNSGANSGGTRELQAICPSSAFPGQMIFVNVPGKGRMRVRVPNGIRPGQTFKFRVRD